MDNKQFSIADLDQNKLDEIRKLEQALSAEFGKEILLIAWEKQQ